MHLRLQNCGTITLSDCAPKTGRVPWIESMMAKIGVGSLNRNVTIIYSAPAEEWDRIGYLYPDGTVKVDAPDGVSESMRKAVAQAVTSAAKAALATPDRLDVGANGLSVDISDNGEIIKQAEAIRDAADDAEFEKAKEQAKMPIDKQIVRDYGRGGLDGMLVISPLRKYPELRKPAEVEIERREQQARQADEVEKLRKVAEAKRSEDDKARAREIAAEWINSNGSDRLKRCLIEGIECNAAYRSERLGKEATGWVYYDDIPERADDPRNPPEEAFALLERARQIIPDARLVWLDSKQYAAIADCPWDNTCDIVTDERFPAEPPSDEGDE